MKNLTLALLFLLFVYSGFAQNTNEVFNRYIEVKNALVSGDIKATSRAVRTLREIIKADGDFSHKDALLKATETMAKTSTIEEQRAEFNNVSTDMWQVVKGSQKVFGPAYYQYCPMKKTYWISKEKEIENPYYGSTMLTCGKVVDRK
jgi:hypothetical protein